VSRRRCSSLNGVLEARNRFIRFALELFAAFSFRDCRTRVFVRNSDMASPKKTATKAASAPKKAAAKTKGERKPNAYQEFMKAESAKIREYNKAKGIEMRPPDIFKECAKRWNEKKSKTKA